MNTTLKIVIGTLLTVLGVYTSLTFWADTYALIRGMIGPILVLIGVFLVWLESDNWRRERTEGKEREPIQEKLAEATESREQQEEEEDNEMYECPICGKEFDTERGMRIHKTQKHG